MNQRKTGCLLLMQFLSFFLMGRMSTYGRCGNTTEKAIFLQAPSNTSLLYLNRVGNYKGSKVTVFSNLVVHFSPDSGKRGPLYVGGKTPESHLFRWPQFPSNKMHKSHRASCLMCMLSSIHDWNINSLTMHVMSSNLECKQLPVFLTMTEAGTYNGML